MAVINKTRDATKKVPAGEIYNQKKLPVSVNYKELNNLVHSLGVKCKVYKTVMCPNIKSIDGAEHKINCPLCHGKGLVDLDPIDTYVGFVSQTKDKQWNPANIGSTWEEGSVMGTFISGVELTYYTLVELPDFSMPFSQVVQRQPGGIDRLRYKATSVNLVVDSNGNTYKIDSDFKIDNGLIKWESGKGPAAKQIYSIHYNCLTQYRAMNAIHQGRYSTYSIKQSTISNVSLNENWRMRLEYLVDVTGNNNEVVENKIFEPN